MTTGARGGEGDPMFSQIVFIEQGFLFGRIIAMRAREWFLSCMIQHMLRKLTLDVKFRIASGMRASMLILSVLALSPIKFASTGCVGGTRMHFKHSHSILFSVIR